MTREDDSSPCTASKYTELEDLKARVALANSCNADLFISIHNDAFTNPAVNGTTVFYSAANPKNVESLHLAGSIRTSVIDIIKTTDRGVKPGNLYVLNNTKIPAILLEIAFISNPYEEARLQNQTFRENAAAGIFRGIYAYFTTPIPKD
ncbi:Germination-specific N-acetylmuramoyl-L-alanine amidase [bioreactor metagenome]